MKRFSLLFLLMLGHLQINAQVVALNPNPLGQPTQPLVLSPRKIQIAILFDTSGSMQGLIEQAKSTIWQIVNAASNLRFGQETPALEIALYDYGNSNITTPNFVRKQVDLIGDLDSISEKLFSLSIDGGDEYCAAVIESSLKDLKWSTNPEDLKIIYIAGNEPFNQGPIDYKKILKEAANSNVIVNTIYCGPYDQGVKEFWYDGALISQGNYFNIDSNKDAFHVDTPYDKDINVLNDSLNKTYLGYGSDGVYRLEKQKKEDKNAESKGNAAVSERAVSKSQKNYNNSEWDMIDGAKEGKIKLDSLKDEDLPQELKGKSLKEKEEIIATKSADRTKYQKEIADLAKKRSEFIEQEKKKRALESGQNDLGTSIIKSMNTSAQKIGYTIE